MSSFALAAAVETSILVAATGEAASREVVTVSADMSTGDTPASLTDAGAGTALCAVVTGAMKR